MRRESQTSIRGGLLALFISCSMLAPASAFGQLEATLERFTGANAEGYLRPLVNALATDFNRGWYHTAAKPEGFHIYIGSRAMVTFISDEDRSFRASTEGAFTPAQTITAPTVVGDTKTASISGTAGTVYTFPAGFDIQEVLYAAPQVTIGSVLGTEATIRYVAVEIGDGTDIGKIGLFGFGIRHSISQYLGDLPMDISAGYFYQRFRVGDDFFDATSSHYGLQFSRAFSVLTLYGGVGYDQASVDVDYTPDSGSGTPIQLEIDSEAGARFTAGLNLKLAIFNLNADYSLGQQQAVSAGFGFVF